MNFEGRIAEIARAEDEFRNKLPGLVPAGSPVVVADLFVMGAARRFLALSSGFRTLASERNFPSCAGLLRMQIDNAARMNALRIVPNMFEFCERLLRGERFDKLRDVNNVPLTDSHLIAVLSADHPWVKRVYQTTSGDVHLSMNAFYSGTTKIGEDGAFELYIGAGNPAHSDEDYFAILESFYLASQVSGTLVLGYFQSKAASLSSAADNI